MKSSLLAFLFLGGLITSASAAIVTIKRDHSVIQGHGQNLEQARSSAIQSLPQGWHVDADYASLVECHEDILKQSPDDCDFEAQGIQVRVTLPIVRDHQTI